MYGGFPSHYAEYYHENDHIDVLLDLDKRYISYVLNGRDIGIAFTNLNQNLVQL